MGIADDSIDHDGLDILRDFDVVGVLNDALMRNELDGLPIDFPKLRAQLRWAWHDVAPARLTDEFVRVIEQRHALDTAELDAHVRERRVDWVICVCVAAATAALLWRGGQMPDVTTRGFRNAFVSGLAAAGLYVVAMAVHRGRMRERRVEASGWLEASRLLQERMRSEAAALIRELVNQQLEDKNASIALLRTSHAPALVELSGTERIAVRLEEELHEFIEAHEASAIGVAGPRGIGKTTAIRAECDFPERIGVYVSAPVRYKPEELVAAIHLELARVVHDLREPEEADNRFARVLTWVAVGAMVACNSVATVWGAIDPHVRPLLDSASVAWVVIVIFSGVIMKGEREIDRLRADRKASSTRRLAEEELIRLGFSAQLERSLKGGIGVGRAAIERGARLSLSERTVGHPERVAWLADFVRRLRQLSSAMKEKKVVIGIDELDKLATGDELIEMVNGLKDLFHVPGTHYLVSVSEDALCRFTSRGVPARDVFDSAFDAVVRARPLEASESIRLLRRRVVDFPEPAALFCHAWGGGVPRDVIRAARACVGVRRRAGEPVPLSHVAEQVIRHDVMEFLASFILGSTAKGQPALAGAVQVRRALHEGGALPVAVGEFGESSTPSPLTTFLHAAVVIHRHFTAPRTASEWQESIQSGEAALTADCLAEAISLVATLPSETRYWLERAGADRSGSSFDRKAFQTKAEGLEERLGSAVRLGGEVVDRCRPASTGRYNEAVVRRAADIPRDPPVVVLNPDDEVTPETFAAWLDRRQTGEPVDPGISAAETLAEARASGEA